MNKLIIICFAICAICGCTDNNKASEILSEQGYTQIELTGYVPFVCSNDDIFSTGFKAKNPNGKYVTGTVCNGVLKGATIRF